jgi:RNA polymerase sigma-32 factor
MNNYLSLSSFSNADSFSLYQQSIQEIPFLTEEEEYELGMRLKKDNDLEAAKKLILSHLKLVMKIARSYSGYGLPQSDLVQEGNIGLIKAVKKLDVDILALVPNRVLSLSELFLFSSIINNILSKI